jgi:hypothetical protein
MDSHRANNANRLVQRLCRDRALVERLRRAPDAVFREHGVSPDEGKALLEGTLESLTSVGLHPILQAHWRITMNPEIGNLVNMKSYLDRMGLK